MKYNDCAFINLFRGETAHQYDTHLEYVKSGDWGIDYLMNWLEGWGEGESPSLEAIGDCCITVAEYIRHWLAGVEAGKVDPNAWE